MPYKVEKQGDEFAVVNADTGKVEGKHPTKDKAEAQMRALYSKEPDASKRFSGLSQQEVQYSPVSVETGKACSACRWFMPVSEGDPANCFIVEQWPEPIVSNGLCKRFEVAPPLVPPQPIEVVIVEPPAAEDDSGMMDMSSASGSAFKRLAEWVKSVLVPDEQPLLSGFKEIGHNRWVGWFTNNFEDRDGEIFTEKAIDHYIDRPKSGAIPYPELWFSHIPGTKHGMVEQIWRIGHFVVATGTFDDTPMAAKFRRHYQRKAHGMSHGYFFPRAAHVDGVYHRFTTFEISPLLPRVAANPYTSFDEVKSMNVPETLKKELEAALGKDEATAILTAAEQRGKALEEIGTRYKMTDDLVDETARHDAAAAKAAQETLTGELTSVKAALEAANARASSLEALVKTLETQLVSVPELTKQVADMKAAWAKYTELGKPPSQADETLLQREGALAKWLTEQEKQTQPGGSFVERALNGTTTVTENGG